MRSDRSVQRGTRILLIAVAVTMLLGVAEPAAADCNPPGADMSFRKAAPRAVRILVGKVVAVGPGAPNVEDGSSYWFTVAVEHTLRGPSVAMVNLDHVETGACVRWLSASVGDQIALALDVRPPDPSVPHNMAASLGGAPAESAVYERLTLAEVVELAGTTAPRGTSPAERTYDAPRLDALPAMVAAAFAVLSAWYLARRLAQKRRG